MMNDLISRQAAIDEAKEWVDSVYFEENDKRERKAIECFIGSLKNLPTADVRENVRGKWWYEPHANNTWVQRCSNCFQIAMITFEEECPYNYCPICGADMRGGKT